MIWEEHKEEVVKLLQENNNDISKTARAFCTAHNILFEDTKHRRTLSKFLEKEGITNNKIRIEDTEDYKIASEKVLSDTNCYIITYEQNNTPINKSFWNNILRYKEYRNAELSVIAGVYHNPRPKFYYETIGWNEETEPYRDANRHNVHKYVTIASDVKLLPTAVNPLSSMASLTEKESIILGHPKLSFKTEVTLEEDSRKYLLTTGAVTLPNYSDKKAGKKAEAKHKYGFAVVEIEDDNTFYIRQVEADKNGNFYDIDVFVSDKGVQKVDSVKGIVFGDIHGNHLDEKLIEPIKNVCKTLNPNEIVLHDIVDGESVNNHIVKDPIAQFHRYKNNNHLIHKEIKELKELVSNFSQYKIIVPRANHNDRFDRYLVSNDWKKDIANAETYLRYLQLNFNGELQKGIIAYELEKDFENVLCLDYNDTYKIGGYEVSQHGHIGANGSKGNNNSFVQLNTKVITGHDHTAFRHDDTFSTGTCTKTRLDYTKGMSSWTQAMTIIHNNDVAQLVTFYKSKYKL